MGPSHNSRYTVTKGLSYHKWLGLQGSVTDQLACFRNCNLQLARVCLYFGSEGYDRGKEKKKKKRHRAEVLVLGDASFQSHPFYESIYGPSFVLGTFWVSKQDQKSNRTLTHHHKVKFASQYLKLTENIFDMKKQKATTTRSFRFCLMCSTCRYYIFNHPLNGRGLEGFGEDKAAFKFTLHNNVISKP